MVCYTCPMTGGGVVGSFGPPVGPRAHSTASSVGSSSSTQARGRERQSGTGSARSALAQHTSTMEAELERDWAYLCQTFTTTERGEEKQYTELSAPPLPPLISTGEVEGEAEHVLEGGEDFAAIDFVRTGVAVEEVSPPTVVGDVAEAEERVREALGMPSMVRSFYQQKIFKDTDNDFGLHTFYCYRCSARIKTYLSL